MTSTVWHLLGPDARACWAALVQAHTLQADGVPTTAAPPAVQVHDTPTDWPDTHKPTPGPTHRYLLVLLARTSVPHDLAWRAWLVHHRLEYGVVHLDRALHPLAAAIGWPPQPTTRPQTPDTPEKLDDRDPAWTCERCSDPDCEQRSRGSGPFSRLLNPR